MSRPDIVENELLRTCCQRGRGGVMEEEWEDHSETPLYNKCMLIKT
jgi:hypothetical protein